MLYTLCVVLRAVLHRTTTNHYMLVDALKGAGHRMVHTMLVRATTTACCTHCAATSYYLLLMLHAP